MTRSICGWDLPPGCTHRDIENAFGGGRDPTELEEAVWDLIDKAGVPVEWNEKVAKVLNDYYESVPADTRGDEPWWLCQVPCASCAAGGDPEYGTTACADCCGTGIQIVHTWEKVFEPMDPDTGYAACIGYRCKNCLEEWDEDSPAPIAGEPGTSRPAKGE